MNEKNILFIPSNGTHVKLFYPIYKILKEKFNILFLTQGSYKNEGAEDALLELGLEFKKIDEYSTKEPESILEKEHVGIVVVGNDMDVIPQWFINTATKMGIPSVYLQDGLLFDYNTPSQSFADSFFKKHGSSLKLKSLASRLLLSKKIKRLTIHGMAPSTMIHVWGRQAQNYLTSKGVDKERILITGSMQSSRIREIARDSSNLEKTILYAPSDLVFSGIVKPKELHALIHQVCSSLSPLGCKILVKPHPREDIQIFRTLEGKYPNVEVSGQNIYELLTHSGLVITDLSSFALEALAANRPLVIFFPGIEKIVEPNSFTLDLAEKNAAILAKDTHELLGHVKNILEKESLPNRESVEKVVEEYLGKMDGMEASRSANSIMALMDKCP